METKARLKGVIARLFKYDAAALSDSMGPGDLPGWDSLGHMTLMVEIQKEFGKRVPLEDAIDVDSIAGLATILERIDG